MKRLMLLMQTVLQECGTRCGISTDLDGKTIERRVEDEGLEFLTITLPTFCATFERALAEEVSVPQEWAGWRTRGATPVFLGQFLDLIFDRSSGRLLTELWQNTYSANISYQFSGKVSDDLNRLPFGHPLMQMSLEEVQERELCAVQAIRQVTRLFSKAEFDAAQSRVDKAYEEFLECEKELESYLGKFPEEDLDLLILSFLKEKPKGSSE